MNAPAALLSEPLPARDLAARDAAYADRQLAILGRLAEAGLEIAVALEAQAKGGEAVVQGDVAMAYNRVARAVRQTLMLQSKLIEARQAQDQSRANRQAAAQSRAAGVLRDAIEDEANDKDRTERLGAEAVERLKQEDFGDLLIRPFGDVVAGICRDLGLSPDWLRLAEDCANAQAVLTGGKPPAQADVGDARLEVRWLDETPFRARDSS